MSSIPGLSADEADAFAAAVAAPGARVFSRATVLDLDHKPLGQLELLGGQVRWNRQADIVTEATVESDDARDARDLDLHHLVRVEMGIRTEDFGKLWCPVITGWVTAVTDAGTTSEFGLHDKSAIGLVARRRQKFGPNQHVGQAIHDMFEAIGESRFDIPRRLREDGPKLGQTVHVGGHDEDKSPTRMAKRLARKHGLQFFYSGDGRCTLRRPPKRPAIKWSEGDDSDAKLLELVTYTRDLTTIRNRVEAKGRKQLNFPNRDKDEKGPDDKGPDWDRLRAPVEADPGHRFSAKNLRRGGRQLDMHYFLDADTVDSLGDLRDTAEDALRKVLQDRADMTLRSSAVPWINPFDLLSARRFDGPFHDFWMQTGSMELDWSDLTVGYQQTYRRKGRRRG